MPVVGDYPVYNPMMQGVTPQNNSDPTTSLDRVQVMRRLLASQNQGKPSETQEPDPGEAMLPRHAAADKETHPPASLARSSTADRPATSVAEAKRLHELEKNSADEAIQSLFDRAQAAEESGKPQVAKVYYQMIVRHAQGEFKQIAQRRLKELETEKP
jgi:hypothetical protein